MKIVRDIGQDWPDSDQTGTQIERDQTQQRQRRAWRAALTLTASLDSIRLRRFDGSATTWLLPLCSTCRILGAPEDFVSDRIPPPGNVPPPGKVPPRKKATGTVDQRTRCRPTRLLQEKYRHRWRGKKQPARPSGRLLAAIAGNCCLAARSFRGLGHAGRLSSPD